MGDQAVSIRVAGGKSARSPNPDTQYLVTDSLSLLSGFHPPFSVRYSEIEIDIPHSEMSSRLHPPLHPTFSFCRFLGIFDNNAFLPLNVRRILLIRTDRIGDVVLTLPMVDIVRKQWPGAEVSFLVREYTRELVEHHLGISHVLVIDRQGVPRPRAELLSEIRRMGFDVAVHVYPRPQLAWLTTQARIPVRVGTAYRWYSFLFNRKARDHRKAGDRHEAVLNARLLRPLGVDTPDVVRPALFPCDRHVTSAEQVRPELGLKASEPFVILHPGTGGSSKDWPASRFAELAAGLARTMKVVVTGNTQEEQLVRQIVNGSGGVAHACVGRFSLMELAAFIKTARLFISNSTGPLHIAAAVGTPVIGFYPPLAAASVTRWGPLGDRVATFTPDRRKCPQCHGGICSGNVCMEQISVESVAEAAKELIG